MARRRGLTVEEKALWSRVAESAVPMHAAPRTPPEPDSQPAQPVAAPSLRGAGVELPGTLRIGAQPRSLRTGVSLTPHPGQALRSDPLRMDHKTHRRMSQGKLSPDARMDLHGMTLNIAHPALIRFILTSRSYGYRLVLVITGKGKAGGPDAPLPVRPGALRHNVPLWLSMPPLAEAVLQVRPAHRRHGGEGAYYVYLRKG